MKNVNSNRPGRVFGDTGHLASSWNTFLNASFIPHERDASVSAAMNSSVAEVPLLPLGAGGWNGSTDDLFDYPVVSGGNTSGGGNVSEYDYDYDAALETFFWSQLGPPLAVYAATYVVGVAGNGLIIFTICRFRRLKTTTNVFLASLASADLLLILLCIPVKVGPRSPGTAKVFRPPPNNSKHIPSLRGFQQ